MSSLVMSSTTNSDLHLQKFDVDSHKAFPIEGRLRHHRGGLMTCTITNWTPAVVPHKIRTKKLMGSDLYWSINNQRVFGFGNYHKLLRA